MKMVENMLDGIEVRLNVDFFKGKRKIRSPLADRDNLYKSIDAYFDYALGNLKYRSVRFENEVLDIPNFQGNAAVNYNRQRNSVDKDYRTQNGLSLERMKLEMTFRKQWDQ